MSQEKVIDLSKKQLDLVKQIIKKHIPNKPVWAYGSRVTWNASEKSDLDLAVFNCNPTEIYNLKEALEESSLPMLVDVMDWESIPDKFKENIKGKYVGLQDEVNLEGWREVKLGDVAQLEKHSWRVGDKELPYVALEHIVEGKLRLQGIGDSNTIASNKYHFNSDCFLFGKLRPYFRKLYRPNFAGICSTDIWVVKPKGENDKDFLFYFFANKEFVDFTYLGSAGTRMPRADWEFVSDSKWNFPPLPKQKAIAEVLSSLDDKIDLLHRQNKTLENIAQALFRQWCVEEADEEWEERPLDNIANYLNGLACQKYPPKNKTDKLPVLKIKELRNGIDKHSDWATSEVPAKYIVERGDIIFSWSASLMVKIWNHEKCVLNQHLFKVSSTEYPKWFIYLWTKKHIEKFTQIAASKATTMGHIKRGDISNSMVLVPPDNKIGKINIEIAPNFDKILVNFDQIQALQNLRAILLPKLMEGKIHITKN